MPKNMHGEPLETYRPLGRSYFYRADASGQILDVNDADIADMVARGCVVDEFALEASGGASGVGTGSTNIIILQGNSTGTYNAPGLTAANKLLCGFSSRDDLSSTTFNFSPTGFVLASNQLNTANGWYVATGQIIDPTAVDWSGYSLVWLYE
jgi:hypothetical protein